LNSREARVFGGAGMAHLGCPRLVETSPRAPAVIGRNVATIIASDDNLLLAAWKSLGVATFDINAPAD
jgi:hypothetical protein